MVLACFDRIANSSTVASSAAHADSWERAAPPRTILISFDGAQPGVIEKMLSWQGGFAQLIREGTNGRRYEFSSSHRNRD